MEGKTIDLMAPRYEVIGMYPKSPWEVGDILHVESDGELYGKATGYVQSQYIVTEAETLTCPTIFKPLKWYERRSEKEMPEYVRFVSDGKDERLKITKWDLAHKIPSGYCNGYWYYIECCIPITESEYSATL